MSELRLVRSIPVDGRSVVCCEWSPSGGLLAVGLTSGLVAIVNPNTKALGYISTDDAVLALAWSPDERQLAFATAGKGVLVADVAARTIIRRLDQHSGSVWCVAFSPDGSLLASGGDDGKLCIWRLLPSECFSKRLAHHSDSVNAVAWTPQGKLVSCGADGFVHVHDLIFQKETSYEVNSNEFLCLRVSPDGTKIAAAGKNRNVFIYSGDHTRILEGHTSWVWSLSFACAGTLLVSESQDRTIKFWNADDGSLLLTEPISTPKKQHFW
jgi:WD40 repeat protein